jgi:hypothetical protein
MKLWNGLVSVRTAPTVGAFKKGLKKHFFRGDFKSAVHDIALYKS